LSKQSKSVVRFTIFGYGKGIRNGDGRTASGGRGAKKLVRQERLEAKSLLCPIIKVNIGFLPIIKSYINGHAIKSLLDTGACNSHISEGTVKRLKMEALIKE